MGGGFRGQNVQHLVKVVFLCWSFLEVYFSATTYRKAFIVGPKVPYPTLHYPTPPHSTSPLPYPTLPQPCPTPTPTLPCPCPTPTPPIPFYHPLPYPPLPYPTPPLPSYPTPTIPTPTLPYSTQPYPTLPTPYPLRIQTHAHNQASRSRATLSCNSSYIINNASLWKTLQATLLFNLMYVCVFIYRNDSLLRQSTNMKNIIRLDAHISMRDMSMCG